MLAEIIRSEKYETAVEEIAGTIQRFEELDNAIDWAICRFFRDPSVFTQAKGDIYVFKTDKILGFPSFRVSFKVKNKKTPIELLDIQKV